jgi:hypothetical protein
MSATKREGARGVLIVSPHFPPINAPDMQRVRMSLPYFREFGWEPCVLAVAPSGTGEVLDPLLLDTIPADVTVERVRAIPASITRMMGIGNIALRALPSLYQAGSELIASRTIDLVYFSTTMFMAMPLGRLWKRRYGTPYVLDMHDPWHSDYYETHPDATRPPKYAVVQRLHAVLERWTMARADGIISVSSDYLDVLRGRYPRLRDVPQATITFGASRADFDLLSRRPQANRHFVPGDGQLHGVYVGAGGAAMAPALRLLFRALRQGRVSVPETFSRVMLHFVGTDYAPGDRARKTVEPLAHQCGVGDLVREDTNRLSYFGALQLLVDADFLVVIGSDDPAYTPSKIYPYIQARKPILAVLHERSPAVALLRETNAACVVTFSSDEPMIDAAVERVSGAWRQLLERCPAGPSTDWGRFENYWAREMTRRQCSLFDKVHARAAS